MLSIFQNVLNDLTLYETLYVNMCETICYTKKWKIIKYIKKMVSLDLVKLWGMVGALWWAMTSNKLMGMGGDM
jgi:hypothetical protein